MSPGVTHGCQGSTRCWELWIRDSPSHRKSFSKQTILATAPGAGGDIPGGGLGDKVSWSILGSLCSIPADPNWEYWERIRGLSLPWGVTPCRARCHLMSPPSSRAEDIQGPSGIGAVPIFNSAGNLGIPGFHKPCQDPIPAGNPPAPGDIRMSLSMSPSLPSTSIPSPAFCPEQFPKFPGSSLLHPLFLRFLQFPGLRAPGASRSPAHPVLAPRWNSALPTIPESPTFPVLSLFWESQGLLSPEFWDVKGLERFPGSRWRTEFLMMALSEFSWGFFFLWNCSEFRE